MLSLFIGNEPESSKKTSYHELRKTEHSKNVIEGVPYDERLSSSDLRDQDSNLQVKKNRNLNK